MEEILQFLINYAEEHFGCTDVDPNDSIQNSIDADSLDVAEMMVALEERFGYYLPDGKLIEMDTLYEIAEYAWKDMNGMIEAEEE